MKEKKRVSIGIFTVTRDHWKRFLAMMNDSSDNFSSWERWRLHVDQVKMDMAKKGVEIIEVEVDLDDFSSWCDEKSITRDGASRSRYVSELLLNQEKD
jgi:hypothetical protein